MSLINDALKRAKDAPPPPPVDDTGLEPVSEPPPQPPSQLPVIIFPILLAVILGLAAFFLVRGLSRNGLHATVQKVLAREKTPPAPVEPATDQDTDAAPADPPVVAKQGSTTTKPVPSASTTNAASPAVATQPATAAGAAPTPTFKVQGIFFSARNPSAVINSKMVRIGDRVGDAKVVAIEKDSVTIEVDGTKKVLPLF